jgi:hypothetical protein
MAVRLNGRDGLIREDSCDDFFLPYCHSGSQAALSSLLFQSKRS